MLLEKPYDRGAAVDYAARWAFDRNPRYLDFRGLGGDCTNVVSQCVFAGSGQMNYTADTGWFYISADNRAAAWTGVPYFYKFMTSNAGPGPYGRPADLSELRPGDVVQLGDAEGRFYHSLFVVGAGNVPSPDNIRVATHTADSFDRPLGSYLYEQARGLHIEGVRRAGGR